jgi:hypothetical protein
VVIHTVETPSGLDNANGQQITLGVGFQLNVASKTCYGVRFWAPATNTGTYTALLYEATDDDVVATGTELTRKAISSASITAGTWNVILFDTPVSLVNTKLYKASVHTSSGRYVNRASVFAGADITGDGITLYQNGADPIGLGSMRNGVFLDNALGYPTTQFSSSDYYVEPWVTAAGGLSGSAGRVTVADSGRTVGSAKARSAGRVTESHTARSMAAAKSRTAGRVAVFEASRAVTRTKVAPLGRVSVADTARIVARAKSAAVGRVATSEAARPIGSVLQAATGRVAVTDTARAVSRAKLRALGRVLVAENARGVLRAQAAAIGRVSETSVARNVGALIGSDLIATWGIDIGLG